MSGGFFRGTSADQDTRFSNKQAKLMKSQKFAPELDHIVDMSKVKMDVVKPWIAHRVTELLGFEDEVLINFIYGLLDGKDINGKEVQIQITGFMEKNTGKFMKELWGLLLSAEKNASGVPQQFLDAKKEELERKRVESDRITHEIQKKKELEYEKKKKMDEEADLLKVVDEASNLVPKHSTAQPEDGKGSGERNMYRVKHRSSRSPHSVKRSPFPDRINCSRSVSKSNSNSGSYSDDRLSRSPQSRGRSITPDRRNRSARSPRKHSPSISPKLSPRRPKSPLRRRSPHSRRRSPSYSRRRSPSPRRRRSPSPRRRRSPSSRRRRSPTPIRRRSPPPMSRRSPSLSPARRRSPLPMHRRSPSLSPVRRRSPPPMHRRSPSLSPVRRRSSPPLRRRSPSPPLRRRSPSPLRRRAPSPVRWRSPVTSRRRSPSPSRYRSPSPVRRRSPLRSPRQRRSPLRSPRRTYRNGSSYRSPSPAYRRRRSLSKDHVQANGVGSRRYRDDYVSERSYGKNSYSQISERDGVEHFGNKGSDPVAHQPPISLRSPQRVPRDQSDAGRKLSVLSHDISPSQSGSSLHTGKSIPRGDRRTSSLSEGHTRNTREHVIRADSASPVRQARHMGALHDSVGAVREEGTRSSRADGGKETESPQRRTRHSPRPGGHRNIPTKETHHEEISPVILAGRQLREAEHRLDDVVIRRNDRDKKSEKASLRMDHPLSPKRLPHMMDAIEYGPGRVEDKRISPENARDEHPSAKQRSSPSPQKSHKSHSREDNEIDKKKHPQPCNDVNSGLDSENEKNKMKDMERRKHKRQGRHHMASDDNTSYDSHTGGRKEAKRRKKEEKKLRKEEKRRRREERHRRREERRASKLKAKTTDAAISPSDVEKNQSDADYSDEHVAARIDSHPSDTEETESEQKKLEIELRKKALESLRAKKAIIP